METQEQNTTEDSGKVNFQTFLESRQEIRDSVDKAFDKFKDLKKFDRKDVLKIVSELRTLVMSNDQLNDIVVNDLMIIDNRFTQLEQRLLMVGQSHTVMKQVLEDKNLVSKEDMQSTWDTKIKPQIEEKIEAAKKANNPTGLVDVAGNPV